MRIDARRGGNIRQVNDLSLGRRSLRNPQVGGMVCARHVTIKAGIYL